MILEPEEAEEALRIADGSHRHEALRRLGLTEAWAVVWCNSQDQRYELRNRLADLG